MQQCSWHLLGLAFCHKFTQSLRRPTDAIPSSTRQKGKTLFLASLPALPTQQLVGFRSGATQTGSFNTATGAGALLFNTAEAQHGIWRRGAFIQHHRHRQHSRWSGHPFKQHYRQLQHGDRFTKCSWPILPALKTRPTAHSP